MTCMEGGTERGRESIRHRESCPCCGDSPPFTTPSVILRDQGCVMPQEARAEGTLSSRKVIWCLLHKGILVLHFLVAQLLGNFLV